MYSGPTSQLPVVNPIKSHAIGHRYSCVAYTGQCTHPPQTQPSLPCTAATVYLIVIPVLPFVNARRRRRRIHPFLRPSLPCANATARPGPSPACPCLHLCHNHSAQEADSPTGSLSCECCSNPAQLAAVLWEPAGTRAGAHCVLGRPAQSSSVPLQPPGMLPAASGPAACCLSGAARPQQRMIPQHFPAGRCWASTTARPVGGVASRSWGRPLRG